MPRPRRHASNKARVDAYRQRHARKRRLELFIDQAAVERLDTLAQAQNKNRSELIEGLLLKGGNVTVNVTGHESKSTGNGTQLPPEVFAQVQTWRAEGLSWSQCAKRLDAQGIEPPRGGRWDLGNGKTNLSRFIKPRLA